MTIRMCRPCKGRPAFCPFSEAVQHTESLRLGRLVTNQRHHSKGQAMIQLACAKVPRHARPSRGILSSLFWIRLSLQMTDEEFAYPPGRVRSISGAVAFLWHVNEVEVLVGFHERIDKLQG